VGTETPGKARSIRPPGPPGDWQVDVAAVAGSLVHEIKNPLSTLNINAQLLLEDWKDAREPRELRTVKRLRVILGEVVRLEGIVQSFLRFTERHELALKEVNINDVVKELVEFVGPEALRKRIQFRTSLDQSLKPFYFDRDLIKQVILNLIRNAVQAMESKGSGELILITRREEGWVLLDVIDTGVGISDWAQERVFNLYFSTKQGGSGLGLATSNRIVKEHGGSIELMSEEGRGSEFTIRLPVNLGPECREGRP